MYGFKECSSCGALYNREHCCSNVSFVDNFVRDPNPISYDETPDSSQQPPRNCSKCGGPFGGLHCRQCTCDRCRRKFMVEVCSLCCGEDGKLFDNCPNPTHFKDFYNSLQQPQTHSAESFNDNPNFGYTPQEPFVYNQDPGENFHKVLHKSTNHALKKANNQPEDIQELLHKLLKDVQIISEELADYINTPNWNCPAFYDNDDEDDDEEYTIAITPDIDNVDAIPSDSELVSLEEVKDFNTEDGEIDIDILLTIKDNILREKLLNINLLIAKIEALKDNPTPSTDSVLKSPSLFPNSFLEETDTSDNSLPESEIFCFDMEEKSSGNPTSHSDLSLPDYEAFYCDNEPDSENFTIDVVEDIFDNPTRELYVHVPNVFPTHPILYLDSDFAPSDDSLRSDLVVSFASGTRNKIFDPGIFIEVQSKRFLSPNELSISFIRDPLSPVFDTLLPFSSENEEKVFNPGSLSSNEEKSPHLLSHRGFNPSKIISDFSKSPMMISGGDIPILDVSIAPDYEASRARGFVLRSLELQSLA
ncbi:hypothetical protein Tco_0345342 [Tanacetum coccineum]